MQAEDQKATLTNYGPCEVPVAATLDPVLYDLLKVYEKHAVVVTDKDPEKKLVAVAVKKGPYLEALVMMCGGEAQGLISALSAYFGFAHVPAQEVERMYARSKEQCVHAMAERIGRKLGAAAVVLIGEPVEAQ